MMIKGGNMLIYKGGGFIVKIPARDLTDEEVKEYGGEKALINSGLYEKPAKETKNGGEK
jgi:hypothetical protein